MNEMKTLADSLPDDIYRLCTRCKNKLLTVDNFGYKKNGDLKKMCNSCLEKSKAKRERNKCPHNRNKYYCLECKGDGICEHNIRRAYCFECKGSQVCKHDKLKSRCIECGGSAICEHNRQKTQCRDCKGGAFCEHDKIRSQCKICKDPVKLTLKNMVVSSRQKDKKYNIYDADRFIDYCFLEGLVEDYPTCYWDDCKTTLQYVKYQDDLATIERLDNSIGHIKSNCVLACKRCNCLRKSNRQ